MDATHTVEQLAAEVDAWCDRHGVAPASGQAGERITGRNVRYYRTLGLLDPPLSGGGQGYGEKHRLQLVGIRLLQAQGQPLNRIRDLLFGRTLEELRRIEQQGLTEAKTAQITAFRPSGSEAWTVTLLDDEFLLISRRGRGVSEDVRGRVLRALHPKPETRRRARGATTKG